MKYQYLLAYGFNSPARPALSFGSIVLSMKGPLRAEDLPHVYGVIREQGKLSSDTVIVPIAFSRFEEVTPMPADSTPGTW